jgi:hypothetical protein
MADKLKSAYDLAMERLARQDSERGEKPTPLGKGQKEEIAELRRLYKAKIAEREIQHQTERRSAASSTPPEELPEALEKLAEMLRRDRERLELERDAKISAVRDRRPASKKQR